MDLGYGPVSWSCHICKRERPDDKISVYQRPLVVRGVPMGKQNIRYCNDDANCTAEAAYYDHTTATKRRS